MYNFTDLIARSYLEYTVEQDDDIAHHFSQEYNLANANYIFSKSQFYRKLILKIDTLINAPYTKIEPKPVGNRYINEEEEYYEMELAEERQCESEREDAEYFSYLEESGYKIITLTPINLEDCNDALLLTEAINNGDLLKDPITIISPNKEVQADDLVLRKSKLEYLKTEAIRARDASNITELDAIEALPLISSNITSVNQLNYSQPTNEKIIQDFILNALEIIKPLGGVYVMDRLLDGDNMERLNLYVTDLIKTGDLPTNLLPFPRTSLPNQFIRKTIHLIYILTKKKNRGKFIELTHLFQQFKGTEHTTTDSKFATYEGKYEETKSLITF